MALSDKILAEVSKQRTANQEARENDQLNRAGKGRVPFQLTTRKRLADSDQRVLVFRCNPGDISYEHPQRGATQDVKTGKVFYYWRNRTKKSHWDLPAITFTFQSGNIRPIVITKTEGVVVGVGSNQTFEPEGIQNFYEYMSIYDEEKVLSTGVNAGSPNFVIIRQHSYIYPNLLLEGFFDPTQPISYTESSKESPMITWQGRFLVHDSFPPFNSLAFQKTFGTQFLSGVNISDTEI